MQQLSKLLLTKVTQSKNISRLNTNSYVKKPYKFSIKNNAIEAVQHIFQDLNQWYVNAIGLAEVQKYQNKVVEVQAKLLDTQEKRREVSKQLSDLRVKSSELQEQLHKLKREDELEKFLEVMRQETEILRKEKEVSRIFTEYDRAERDLFTDFTNAVRESHEKQRSQLEYTKYLGLALSIIGSFLTFCYTSLKKHELKIFIEEKLSTSSNPVPVTNDASETKKELRSLIGSLRNDMTELLKQHTKDASENYQELPNYENNVGVVKATIGIISSIFISILSCCCCR